MTKVVVNILFTGILLHIHDVQTLTEVGHGAPGAPCKMGGNVMGQCEEVDSCLRDGGVVRREEVVKLCAPQDSKIFVCCRKPRIVADELCRAWSQFWRRDDGKCVHEQQLIVGGVDAKLGEFPHIAIVGTQTGNRDIKWICGGSLISPHYVLTAAHCIDSEATPQFWVTLGEHDLGSEGTSNLPRITGTFPLSLLHAEELAKDPTQNAPTKQRIKVKEIIHPKYANSLVHYYDIALLELQTPATLTRRVLPACLHSNTSQVLTGKELTVAGWGYISFGFGELSRILQKVTVPVVDPLKCQARWSNSQSPPRGVLSDQLCAGAPGRDSCGGDSGGPLFEQLKGGDACEQTVVGLVSFGPGCGGKDAIGVYTRVSAFLDWITGYIAPN